MGALYKFRCLSCGYSAMLTGGLSIGIEDAWGTVACEECRKLYDVLAIKDAWHSKQEVKQECPRDKSHHVIPWQHPGECPRCGAQMIRGKMAGIWD